MDICHYSFCMKCRSPDHHTIECVMGEMPLDHKVITKTRKDTPMVLTQKDVSFSGDLISFDEDEDFSATQLSKTDDCSDLKGLLIDRVEQGFGPELSPTTPNYEARFQEDMQEAMRRSLMHNVKVFDPKEEEEMLSDDENSSDMHKLSVDKVQGWIIGDKTASNSIEKKVIHRADDPNEWEVKTTPKTLRNRELLPKSSLLTFQRSELSKTDSTKVKRDNKTYAQAVTRTLNPENATMTVSNLPVKRRGRGNRRSYINITGEMQYLP